MISALGHFSLVTALMAGGAATVASVAAARFGSGNALRVARGLLGLYCGFIVLASAALVDAFIQDDFLIQYVAGYSERALPAVYKVTAFWAGQQGSLLLWALLLAVMMAVYLFQTRRSTTGHPIGVITLAVLGTFFAALLIFAADPFALSSAVPQDGQGLNPLLQNFGMIAHPPVLFAGYAGLTFPFILMLEALAAGRKDDQWITAARPWVIVAWLFLSAGIVLGAQWAYVELGWGGYWAWDPVENASLLPWLTSTALLHTLMVQRQKKAFRFWTAGLTAASFILCIFGTYLTRSGVIQSVHAFPESSIGQFFLVLLAGLIILSVGIILWRASLLKSYQHVEGLLSKDGLFLVTNILLVLMTATVLVGTIFPILSQATTGRPITVKPAFYNTIVAPMGLLLLALMALGPMLGYGRESAARTPKRMLLPGLVAAGAVVGALAGLHLTDGWALACVAIISLGVAAVIEDLIRATLLRAADLDESIPLALVRLFDRGHRRYGGQLVHLGMMMILAGVAGSSLFAQKQLLEVKKGESARLGAYAVRFNGLEQADHDNYMGIEADVTVTDRSGQAINLRPDVRFFKNERWADQQHHEVALSTNLTRDIYITLAAADEQGTTATFEVLINPLVLWIWIGGGVMALGGILCLVPPLLPSSRLASVAATPPQSSLPRSAAVPQPANLANGSTRQIPRAKTGNGKSRKGGKAAAFAPQTEN